MPPNNIMKLLCTFLLIAFPLLQLFAQNVSSGLHSESIQLYYLRAKKDFADFEKVHGHFIQTKNVRMHYLTWGNPNNIPLIWCHGSLSNAYEFTATAEALAGKGYYVSLQATYTKRE